jgi:hypothetical protein
MRTLSRWIVAMMIAVLVLFSALFLADAARAQTAQCAPVDQMLTLLADKYGEQLIGEGQGPNGFKLLMFAHPEGDTWTVVGVIPGGQACFIASGESWTVHDFTPAGSET